jgi:hypothetical protein
METTLRSGPANRQCNTCLSKMRIAKATRPIS